MKKMFFSAFRSRTLTLAVLALFSVFTTSCGNEDESGPAQPKTIADYIVENDDFTILEAAIRQAGQLDAFKNPNLTFFAPNDAAFRASGFADASALATLTKEQLTAILQYHVLKAAVKVSGFPTENNRAVQTSLTINNQPAVVYISNNQTRLTVNGTPVSTPDIQVANGIIHIIDRILLPPPLGTGGGTLVGVVATDTSLSLLGTAALRVAAVNPTLAGVLTGTDPYTAFAPTNNAFRALKLSTPDTINKVPATTLATLLANHVVAGRLYSSDLKSGVVTAYGTGKLTVNADSTVMTVKSNGIATPARIVQANLTATNGVVHKIDKVLL
ncbi:hypothetical protein GCM10027347_33120 [Larkinella harenae]